MLRYEEWRWRWVIEVDMSRSWTICTCEQKGMLWSDCRVEWSELQGHNVLEGGLSTVMQIARSACLSDSKRERIVSWIYDSGIYLSFNTSSPVAAMLQPTPAVEKRTLMANDETGSNTAFISERAWSIKVTGWDVHVLNRSAWVCVSGVFANCRHCHCTCREAVVKVPWIGFRSAIWETWIELQPLASAWLSHFYCKHLTCWIYFWMPFF